jgi:hypothetical protein
MNTAITAASDAVSSGFDDCHSFIITPIMQNITCFGKRVTWDVR